MSATQEAEPKKERYKTPAAVFILIMQDNKILLHRRQNTGWQDGWYDVPSGHVEANEELRETASGNLEKKQGFACFLMIYKLSI